jgi:hypothetical protein
MIYSLISRWLKVLTKRHALHQPEHVGAYAAGYLERCHWDHP